jgi:hypothetical protein
VAWCCKSEPPIPFFPVSAKNNTDINYAFDCIAKHTLAHADNRMDELDEEIEFERRLDRQRKGGCAC